MTNTELQDTLKQSHNLGQCIGTIIALIADLEAMSPTSYYIKKDIERAKELIASFRSK